MWLNRIRACGMSEKNFTSTYNKLNICIIVCCWHQYFLVDLICSVFFFFFGCFVPCSLSSWKENFATSIKLDTREKEGSKKVLTCGLAYNILLN